MECEGCICKCMYIKHVCECYVAEEHIVRGTCVSMYVEDCMIVACVKGTCVRGVCVRDACVTDM